MAIAYGGGGSIASSSQLYDDLPEGILFAVSIISDVLVIHPHALWASLSIASEASTTAARSICLCQGWLSREAPLSWTGFLPIMPAAFYALSLRGDLTNIVRMEDIRMTFDAYRRLINGQ